MAIKVKQNRTIVTPEFVSAMLDIYKVRHVAMLKEITTSTGAKRRSRIGEYKYAIPRLNDILEGNEGLRKGLGYEKTRLRGLNFTKFEMIKPPNPTGKSGLVAGKEYLAGTTRNLICHDASNRHVSYDIGPYMIFVPIESIILGQLTGYQCIPLRDPDALNRHPHHLGSEAAWRQWCWHNWANSMGRVSREGDIPVLFRNMEQFMSMYNSDHGLCTMYEVRHAIRIEETQ